MINSDLWKLSFIQEGIQMHFINGKRIDEKDRRTFFPWNKPPIFALNIIYISHRIEANCISGKVCIKYKLHTPLKFLLPPIKIKKISAGLMCKSYDLEEILF